MPGKKETAIIIDDEPEAIEQLLSLLSETERLEITATFNTTNKAIISILKNKPDLLFLDVQMPGQDGIDFLKDLQQLEDPPTVIMVTAFENYMLEAFRNNAFDYLLKPVDRAELKNVIDRYKTRKPKQNIKSLLTELNNKIRIPGIYETHFLNPKQIFYLQGDGKYTDIFLTNETRLKTSINLGKLNDELPPESFKRISKTHIINTTYLQKINHRAKRCLLQSGELKVELTCSKKYFQ